MTYQSKSIRAFIGARVFEESRQFYSLLGFEEVVIDRKMSLFKVNEHLAFYLQDYYAKEWINNTMLFLEVDDLDRCQEDLLKKNLPARFNTVRFSAIRNEVWGRELFMHDPSGVLWHFGEFKQAPNS